MAPWIHFSEAILSTVKREKRTSNVTHRCRTICQYQSQVVFGDGSILEMVCVSSCLQVCCVMMKWHHFIALVPSRMFIFAHFRHELNSGATQ